MSVLSNKQGNLGRVQGCLIHTKVHHNRISTGACSLQVEGEYTTSTTSLKLARQKFQFSTVYKAAYKGYFKLTSYTLVNKR